MDKQQTQKTLFEDKLEDIFLKSYKDFKPKMKPKTLEAYFQILSSSSKKAKYYQYYFELHGRYIVCKHSQQDQDVAYMDIKNTFIRLTHDTKINEELNYGIKFIKKKAYEELFTKDQKVAQQWFDELKKYCIMTKFRLYYQTIRVLGQGNYAKVLLVQRKSDQKEFAVKIFGKKEILEDKREKECLLYEIKMMRQMDHPRVLRLQELYEGENFIYCLCELYRGQDLMKSIIQKGSQPENKALAIILQISEAIAYMHSKNIIHRDVKPENIIFKSSNEVLDIAIVDLGFATYEKDYKKLFTRCGTPGYVAPEVLNDKHYNCKADVFSLGVIFYMILTGQMPFTGSTCAQIVQRNMKGVVNFDFSRFGVKVSDDTMNLLKGMLDSNPEKRLSAQQVLNHQAFQTVLSKSPLIKKQVFNADNLVNYLKLTEDQNIKYQEQLIKKPKTQIPDRVEDMSPLPSIHKKGFGENTLSNKNRQYGISPDFQRK